MTANDIFSIDTITHENGVISAVLCINSQSEIFKGHFPDQPVVPGACMLQVVKDVLENALSSSLLLKKAANLKFISMIVPSLNDMVQLELTYKWVDNTNVSVNAKLIGSNVICFKFQGSFVRIG